MKVHPDSQKLMTINTHKGLYICKRLMYGLNEAPAIWQRYVDGLFQASDASPVGIVVVFCHTYIQMALNVRSRSHQELYLGPRKKYSQIDKALSIVWAVRKFYLYLKGRRFTLITDHKPLIAIFGSKRGLPVLAATRLLHYALILQSFEFDIIFRKTIEHGNADFLSRLPKTSEELEVKDDITIFQMSQIEALPVTSKELRQETSKKILSWVHS
ncbi:retrovirus-related Pol polyprotein from transposon 17.6 [Trichonephila clavipes]|nr:retrovirus-related Pol polyprotein from transposon 17.6 [Trichonephila clavipes]